MKHSNRRLDRYRIRPIVVAAVMVISVGSGPGATVSADELPEFTGNEFGDLFSTATLENLAPIGPAPSITGDSSIDARIRAIGEARGYLRRPLPDGPLGSVDGYSMQGSAVAAWLEMKAAARAAGHTLLLQSTFRSHSTQTVILLRRLSSYSPAAIDYRLRTASVPGYSKHHTGYAIDITQPGYAFTSFGQSPAYEWMSANNYANAKSFGWIPSYPLDAVLQGPEPEAWEFTYVGADNIWCYGFSATDDNTFCDDRTSLFESDIEWMVAQGITSGCNPPVGSRFCPEGPVTRGQLAAFFHRALGDSVEVIGEPVGFADTVASVFAGDVQWMSATGITKGCGADTFCPDDPVTRGQLAAFFVRAMGYEDAGSGDLFIDDDHSVFEVDISRLATAGITRGCNPPANDRFCPDELVTREQMAAFLHRVLGDS